MSFTVTANSPSAGYIAWASAHIVYDGVDYTVTDGNSNKKFIYWTLASPAAFQTSDTHPALTTNDAIVFLNKSGVPISVLTAASMEGDIIVPGTVTSESIATNTITASNIATDAIVARHILAGSIAAEKLAVTQLSAISANLGTMTAGNFTLDATGFIKGGATSFAAGTGFWMGYDSTTYKFRAGIPGSSRMEWNGTAFNIYDGSGNLTISSGVVDYTKISGLPTSLSAISATEATKLSGIATGATRNVYMGAWANATVYAVGDVVTDATGSSWACKTAHTSATGTNAPPTLPTTVNTWWTLSASKGTDGLNGTRTAILEVYQWAAAAPTTFPVGSSTYTWATGQFTAPATLNSWALTPPAAVAGQTLWVARTIYSDSATSATSAVTWNATASLPSGASGTNGTIGSNGTRTAVLELYQWSATTPSTFPSGSSTYTWATGGFTLPATPNSWSLTPGAAVLGQTLWGCSVTYADTATAATSAVTWSASSAYALGAAGTNGTNGTNGTSGLAAMLSNEAHVFPADSTGAVTSYANSGTTIYVYEGSTQLTYDGVGTANGSWTVSSAVTNITLGSVTDSGVYATIGAHSGVAAGTDTSLIVYTITGKTAAGGAFTITKQQSFTKAKAGAAGSGGGSSTVAITPNGPTAFTATDGTLDAAQANITLTANTGIASPAYVWTFSGFQTAPTNSGAATQVITAAQFGTAKDAIVTCTVNGTAVDTITFVRLEKSTAAAGATVGATIGTNLSGQITSANASTFIAAAAIGSAQIGSIALVGTSNFSVKTATTGARTEMDSRVIKVYDAAGVVRVQIGDLSL